MSFKREGDDPAQLGVLQKRRVADLLANYIPEDEALLLRSGRYACTVCAHRPVFDTLDVLTVHRAGKKHTGNLQRFYGGKRSLQDAAPRQRHEEEAQAEEAEAQGSPAPLLARTRRIARSALLKAAPYSSCCRRTGVEGSSSRPGGTPTAPRVAPTPAELSLSRRDGGAVGASPAALLPGHRAGPADAPKAPPARTQRGGNGKASSSGPSRAETLSPERRRALERYLQLRSAGWIQDRAGKWVKDENAEFDSDEDEPPALLPA
ncbi:sodium channel modifier 1 [Athene noctua]|uniref:sodium channel modifier 1 n=1 Tax=Athene noctua TaxID=126797 RepID=UPI003EB8D819